MLSNIPVTKDQEKVKNITEAIEVYEEWLEKNASDPSANKNAKPADGAKADTVPGLGFKDADAAKKTLECVDNVNRNLWSNPITTLSL